MKSKNSKFDTPIGELDVRGLKYKIYLYPKRIFSGRYQNTLAQVEDFPYKARFCEENLEIEVIRHEVFHMYIASTFIHTATTEAAEDMEEIAADLFAMLVDDMLKTSIHLQQLLLKETTSRREHEKSS